MPADAAHAVSFRPVAVADLDLIAGWLAEPHVRQWWGEPETEVAAIRDMVEGRDGTRPFLILAAGEPVGYIQVWRISHFQTDAWTADNPWLLALADGTVGVDLMIGEAGQVGKGLGPAVLAAFVAMLRAEGHDSIVIDPDPGNARAVRAFEKAGFRAMPDLAGVPQDVLVMRHEIPTPDRTGRPAATASAAEAR